MFVYVAPCVVVDFPIESQSINLLQLIKQALPVIHKQELPMLYHLIPAFSRHSILSAYVLSCDSVGL